MLIGYGMQYYLSLGCLQSLLGSSMHFFHLFCEVIPIPIVVITVGVRHDYYGVRDSNGEIL